MIGAHRRNRTATSVRIVTGQNEEMQESFV